MSNINDASPEDWDQAFRPRKVPAFSKAADNYGNTIPLDPVENPDHYKVGDIECIDAIKASMTQSEYAGYLKGNTLKYLWRYKYKGKPREDLQKAQVYLTWLIQETE